MSSPRRTRSGLARDSSSQQQMTQSKRKRKDPPTRVTRSTDAIFGFGSAISADDGKITGTRLPTCRQVLRATMFQTDVRFGNKSKWQAAVNVYAQLLVFYKKANIPTVNECIGCRRILELMASNASLRNIPEDRRNAPSTITKLTSMDAMLRTTFRLWPANAEMIVKNAEDLAFLRSMKTDRKASFGERDAKLAGVVRRRTERLARQHSRRARALEEAAETTTEAAETTTEAAETTTEAAETSTAAALSSSDSESVFDLSLTTPSRRSHHRQSRSGTLAFIPHDIHKRPRLVSMATRMHITPTQQAALTEAIIEECGGDPTRISRSYSTVDRSRRKVVGDVAQTIREEWRPPASATLHWDSKLMPSLDNHRREERLTVVVGDNDDLKLLGTPSYQPGGSISAGEQIASRTVELLNQWNCADTIVSMCFDTTASNTGPLTAACVTIQLKLGRALLWSACRHHIGELIVAHVFRDLKIEVSKSPEVSVFQRLRLNWESLPHEGVPTVQLSRFDDSAYCEAAQMVLHELRVAGRLAAQSSIDLRRDDYKEFAKLCDLYLSDDDAHVNLMRPGAIHQARWMAKVIYAIKLVLLEQQITALPRGAVTVAHQVSKLRDFVDFMTHVYCAWWLTSSSVTRAAWNDLVLVKTLHKYTCVNKPISESALRAFGRHYWYVTAELVPLSLFDDDVIPDVERHALAQQMLAMKPAEKRTQPLHRFGTGFGKPTFPKVDASTHLADLVSGDSWFIMDSLGIEASFLELPVSEWQRNDAYLDGQRKVHSINVLNDCAERGIKLTSDFLTAGRSEEHLQNVLQVAENDRKRKSNLRK